MGKIALTLWVGAALTYAFNHYSCWLLSTTAAILTVPSIAVWLSSLVHGGGSAPPFTASAKGLLVALERGGRKLGAARTAFIRVRPVTTAEELGAEHASAYAALTVDAALDRSLSYGWLIDGDEVYFMISGDDSRSVAREVKRVLSYFTRLQLQPELRAPEFMLDEHEPARTLLVIPLVAGLLLLKVVNPLAIGLGLALSCGGILAFAIGGRGFKVWAFSLTPIKSTMDSRRAWTRMIAAMRMYPDLEAVVFARYAPGGEEEVAASYGRQARVALALAKPEAVVEAGRQAVMLRRLEEGERSYRIQAFVVSSSFRSALRSAWLMRSLGFRVRPAPGTIALLSLLGIIKPGRRGLLWRLVAPESVCATLDLAVFTPWVGRAPEHLEGMYLGRDEAGRPVYIDLAKLPAAHGIVVGPTGAGKSTLLRHLAMEFREEYGGAVVFVDPAGEHPGERVSAEDLDLRTPPPKVSASRWEQVLTEYDLGEGLEGLLSPTLLLEGVHSIYTGGLTEGRQAKRAAALVLWLLEYAKANWGLTHWPRILVVVDECFKLRGVSNIETGEGWISHMLRELRKWGLAIVFSSQDCRDFTLTEYSNAGFKIALPSSDQPYLSCVARAIGMGEGDAIWLSAGSRGRCLLHRKGIPGVRRVLLEVRAEAL